MIVSPRFVQIRVGRCKPYCVLPVDTLTGNCLRCGASCSQGEGDRKFVPYTDLERWSIK